MANTGSTESGSSNSDATNSLLAGILQAVVSGSTIEIDGEAVFKTVNNQLRSGRTFA